MEPLMDLLGKVAAINHRLSEDVYGERFHIAFFGRYQGALRFHIIDAEATDEENDRWENSLTIPNYALDDEFTVDRVLFNLHCKLNSVIASSDFWKTR